MSVIYTLGSNTGACLPHPLSHTLRGFPPLASLSFLKQMTASLRGCVARSRFDIRFKSGRSHLPQILTESRLADVNSHAGAISCDRLLWCLLHRIYDCTEKADRLASKKVLRRSQSRTHYCSCRTLARVGMDASMGSLVPLRGEDGRHHASRS